VKTITPEALQKVLAADPKTALLDVRTPAEFAEVHAAQATNAPLGSLRPETWANVPTVYLVCLSGARAANAAEKFAGRGIIVEGGMEAWIKAGLPVIRGTVKAISLERQVRIVAGSLVLAGIVLAKFIHPYFLGLSAFVGAGLVFAGLSGRCGMALLLAKLPWNAHPACTAP
jgi:rhodanese-related sulfurtransferase